MLAYMYICCGDSYSRANSNNITLHGLFYADFHGHFISHKCFLYFNDALALSVLIAVRVPEHITVQ